MLRIYNLLNYNIYNFNIYFMFVWQIEYVVQSAYLLYELTSKL